MTTKFYEGQRVRIVKDIFGTGTMIGVEGTIVDPDDGDNFLPVEVQVDGYDYTTSFEMDELEPIRGVEPSAPMTLAILNHLRDVGNISGNEANAMYKCRSLSRRISDLRECGWDIHREFKVDNTGQRYARYTLLG